MRTDLLASLKPLLLAVTVLSFTASIASAQMPDVASHDSAQEPPHDGFFIKKTVQRVILDVVVTDAQGNAVHGLSRQDFSVEEDRKSQRIASFDAHDFQTPVDTALPRLPVMPANTFVNLPSEPERGPLYAIVYDANDSSWDDQPQARQQLMDFLSSKPAGTRFALFIVSDGLHLAQGFTTDPHQLLSVFDVHRKGAAHIPWIFLFADNFPQSPLQTMINVAQYLKGLPGRKNLIWMASKMPAGFPAGGYNSPAPVNGPLQGVIDLDDEIHDAVNAMTAAQVSVYPIDVAGLSVGAGAGGIDVTADEIAEDTGGHAYYNTNNFKAALTHATEHGSSYYEVSYAPSNHKYDGKKRNIHVVLSGHFSKMGYKLAYRRFYYGDDPDSPTGRNKLHPEYPDHLRATKNNDPLVAHLEHGAPMEHDLLFRAHISPDGAAAMATPAQMADLVDEDAYLRARRKNKPVKLGKAVPLQTYTIDYTVLDRAPGAMAAAGGASAKAMEFGVAAYDAEGKLMNGIVQPAIQPAGQGMNPVGPGTPSNGLYRVQQALAVPTGAVWLRVAVRDLSNQNIGTLEVPLPLAKEPAN